MDIIPSNFRILLIHDVWNEDKTGDAVLELLAKLPQHQYVYLKGKFGSPGAARNAGIDLSNSDWICFWDSDDIPIPQEFNRMISQGILVGAQLCIGSFEMLSNKTPNNHISIGTSNRTQVAISPGFWRMAFSRNVVSNVRFALERMGEDQLFLMAVNYASLKTYRHNSLVYRYFTGGQMQLTAADDNYKELSKTLKSAVQIYSLKYHPQATYIYAIMINRLALTMFKYQREESLTSKIVYLCKINFASPRILIFGAIPSLLVIAGSEFLEVFRITIKKLQE